MGKKSDYTAFIIILLISSIYASVPCSTFMVPMRDSVLLATTICLPVDTAYGPVPIILERTPYGRSTGGDVDDTLYDHGLGLVFQDTRGRGDSGGEDSLFLDNGWGERRDGYDAIEWLAAQPWCNGKVALVGGSGAGITAYLATGASPSGLVCGAIAMASGDLYHKVIFPGGIYRTELVDIYCLLMGINYMADLFEEYYIYDSLWNELDISTRYPFIDAPILHIAGWFDTFCEGNIAAFRGMQHNGAPGAAGQQKLIVGPWCHGRWGRTDQGDLNFPANSIFDFEPTAWGWYLYYLKDLPTGVDTWPAVQCYVMGDCIDTSAPGNEWLDFTDWPPLSVVYDTVYLYRDQSLNWDTPSFADTGLTYFHDPGSPMAHNGGRNLFVRPGPKNNWGQDISAQGIIWTSDTLTEPVTIAGPVKIRLFASSDCIDTDFMVRLCDVYPSGTSYLMTDGAICARFREGFDHEVFMTPGEVYEFDIDIGNTAICFAPGHRIRIGVSSALSNRYEPNPNTGEPFRQNTHTIIANNTIWCGSGYPSSLILPILPDYPTSVAEREQNLPEKIRISAYPNPFNSSVRITVGYPSDGRATVAPLQIEIYDIVGRKIDQLPVGDGLRPSRSPYAEKTGGSEAAPLRNYEFTWQPDETIGSGVYMVRVITNSLTTPRKIVYLK